MGGLKLSNIKATKTPPRGRYGSASVTVVGKINSSYFLPRNTRVDVVVEGVSVGSTHITVPPKSSVDFAVSGNIDDWNSFIKSGGKVKIVLYSYRLIMLHKEDEVAIDP